MNIAYRFGRQAFWLVLRFFSLYSAALAHAVVELLQVVGGELVQFDCSDRIVFDLIIKESRVVCERRWSEVDLSIVIKPIAEPF